MKERAPQYLERRRQRNRHGGQEACPRRTRGILPSRYQQDLQAERRHDWCLCVPSLLGSSDDLSNNYADRVLYTPERLAKIAEEAAKEPSPFSLNDRIGLVHDSMQLARAGHAKLSSALTLVSGLRNEQECEPSIPLPSSHTAPHAHGR